MFIIPHNSRFVLRKHENSGAQLSFTFICFLFFDLLEAYAQKRFGKLNIMETKFKYP